MLWRVRLPTWTPMRWLRKQPGSREAQRQGAPRTKPKQAHSPTPPRRPTSGVLSQFHIRVFLNGPYRTPGPGNFALHTPNAQLNKGTTYRDVRSSTQNPQELSFWFFGCWRALAKGTAWAGFYCIMRILLKPTEAWAHPHFTSVGVRAGIPGFAHATAEKKSTFFFALTREKRTKTPKSTKTPPKNNKNTKKHQKNTPNKIRAHTRKKPLASKKIFFPSHQKWNETKKKSALVGVSFPTKRY